MENAIKNELKELLNVDMSGCEGDYAEEMVEYLLANGVTIPTRCENCRFHHWEQDPCHGKTEHFCSVLKAQVFKSFYCYHGKPKIKEGDKP